MTSSDGAVKRVAHFEDVCKGVRSGFFDGHAATLPSVGLLGESVEELTSGHIEPSGDLHERGDAEISEPALGSRVLDRMDPAAMRCRLLRDAQFIAPSSDVRADTLLGFHVERCSAL